MHVALADEAVLIGPPPRQDSYLRIDAHHRGGAKRRGAEAIHPGYGFLSENADFAQACAEAGLVFVGPSAETIRAMGSKSAAKALMEKSGVPVVPGYHGEDQEPRHARGRGRAHRLSRADQGFGGRRGQGHAHRRQTRRASPKRSPARKREARRAFGDDQVLIEKYLAKPRHIEVQVFGDAHGNVVSLFERECTLQRRHQKVVEEAPVDRAHARAARRDVGGGARRRAGGRLCRCRHGRVHRRRRPRFYFIEMNTRLQVEHPVTEMITGLDLVEWQLRVACGREAAARAGPDRGQRSRDRSAHLCRRRRQGLPAVERHHPDLARAAGSGIRVDTGFRAGDAITPYYDALLAKLIVWGADRPQALARMVEALGRVRDLPA